MVLNVDGQTDGQSWIQSRMSEKTLDQLQIWTLLFFVYITNKKWKKYTQFLRFSAWI